MARPTPQQRENQRRSMARRLAMQALYQWHMTGQPAAQICRQFEDDIDYPKARDQYIKAAVKGVVKTLSKMGISTMQSYCGAQIFEALGLSQELVDEYFTWTPTRIEGIGLAEIYEEALQRHRMAFRNANIQDSLRIFFMKANDAGSAHHCCTQCHYLGIRFH